MAENKTLAQLLRGRFTVEGLFKQSESGCADFELPRAEALLERGKGIIS